MSEECEKKFLI